MQHEPVNQIVIFGASGLGRMVLDLLRQAGEAPCAFLDSDPALHGQTIDGLPVVGGLSEAANCAGEGRAGVVVAIGDNIARVTIATELQQRGLCLVSAIHPLASIATSAHLAAHLIIGPRVTICVNASIGPHSVLSAGAIVEHDNVVGQGVFLQPAVRLAGGVRVADFAHFEIGACVIPGRTIGRGAWIEAGAVVTQDVPDRGRAGGVPARARTGDASRFVAEVAVEAAPVFPQEVAAPAAR